MAKKLFIDPEWFVVTPDNQYGNWYLAWYDTLGKLISTSKDYESYQEARNEGIAALVAERGEQDFYVHYDIEEWDNGHWIQWYDEEYDPTQREGPFANYGAAHYTAQDYLIKKGLSKASKDTLLAQGKILDFTIPSRTRTITEAELQEISESIATGFRQLNRTRQTSSYVVKSFDERWAEGIRQFIPEQSNG